MRNPSEVNLHGADEAGSRGTGRGLAPARRDGQARQPGSTSMPRSGPGQCGCISCGGDTVTGPPRPLDGAEMGQPFGAAAVAAVMCQRVFLQVDLTLLL